MDYPIYWDGFEGRNALLRVGFWGKARLVLDAREVHAANGVFVVRDNSGKVVPIRLHRRMLDPLPDLEVGSARIAVALPLRWFAYLWIFLPVLLWSSLGAWILTAGRTGLWLVAFGLALGFLGEFVGIRILRTALPAVARYVLTGILSATLAFCAVTAGAVLMGVLQLIREQDATRKYVEVFRSHPAGEIHGNTHGAASRTGEIPGTPGVDLLEPASGTIDRVLLRDLLRRGDYAHLDCLLREYQRRYERDFRCEDLAATAFRAFRVRDPVFVPSLDAWVRSSPQSYCAWVARGIHREFLGWEYRGYRWASETPDENFENMERTFVQAEDDLLQGLSLEPRALCAMESLLDMSRARGTRSVAALLLHEGMKRCPYSYRLRRAFMLGLLPRWGGGDSETREYETMEALAADAERYGQVNPRLRSLRGLIAWDKGRIAVRDSNHAEALRLFTVALSAGEDAQVYRSRGDAYWHLKRYGAACADFDSALRLSPQDEQLLLAKSKMLYFVGRLPESVTLLDSALKINPLIRAEVVEWRDYIARKLVSEGFQLYKQRQDQAALKVINRAILYHPAHAEAFYYRGMTYLHLSRWNDAQRDLATCITMDPHYFDAYKALDWLLAQNGEWDQITSYWSRLIAVEPGNAQAYLERGGAYFHKRDFPSAKRDAEKAGALGSEEGRRRALQLKGY